MQETVQRVNLCVPGPEASVAAGGVTFMVPLPSHWLQGDPRYCHGYAAPLVPQRPWRSRKMGGSGMGVDLGGGQAGGLLKSNIKKECRAQ